MGRKDGWSLLLLALAIGILILRFSLRGPMPEYSKHAMMVFFDSGYAFDPSSPKGDDDLDSAAIKMVNSFINAWGKDSVTLLMLAPMSTGSEVGGLGVIESTLVVNSQWVPRRSFKLRRVLREYCPDCNKMPHLWVNQNVIGQKIPSIINTDTLFAVFFIGERSFGQLMNHFEEFRKFITSFIFAKVILVVPEINLEDAKVKNFMNKFSDLDVSLFKGYSPEELAVYQGRLLSPVVTDSGLQTLHPSLYELDYQEISKIPTAKDSAVVVFVFDLTSVYENIFGKRTGLA